MFANRCPFHEPIELDNPFKLLYFSQSHERSTVYHFVSNPMHPSNGDPYFFSIQRA
jgi:hypothetical protein